MSQENVEIVRRCCEAFNRGDFEAALDALDPAIEYGLRHFPDGRGYQGREGVREAFRIWLGTRVSSCLWTSSVIDTWRAPAVMGRTHRRASRAE
jgi:hypothetical protein